LADALGSLDGGVRLRDGLHTPGECVSVTPRTESMRQPDPHGDTRERLVIKRSEIVAKVDQLSAHDPAEVANLGFGKRIGDATAYAVERMTDAYQARTIYATVSEIDQALDRIDAGTYGRCIACGIAIPDERLRAVPWAALCVPCSAKPAKSKVVR
jgi:RNA polymerase-binding transcription factor DksA